MRVLKNSYLKAKEIGGHPVKKKLTAFFFSVQTEQSRGEADNSLCSFVPHISSKAFCAAPLGHSCKKSEPCSPVSCPAIRGDET